MELVDLSLFLPLLRRHIAGPLEDMMRNAIIDSAIQFCRDSKFLVDVRVATNVAANTTLEICTTTGVKASDINSVSDADGNRLTGGIDYRVASANVITPTRDFTVLTIGYAAEPTPDATQIPKPIYDDYAETIVSGALVSLFLRPGMPWTNPQQAEFFKTYFIDGTRRGVRFRLEQSQDPVQTEFDNPVRVHEFF